MCGNSIHLKPESRNLAEHREQRSDPSFLKRLSFSHISVALKEVRPVDLPTEDTFNLCKSTFKITNNGTNLIWQNYQVLIATISLSWLVMDARAIQLKKSHNS